jgi:very-short-patch-repair endonuclease
MIQENNSEKSCKNCGSILKPQQKSYCSRLCQYSGYKIEKVGRIEKICDFCSKIFNVKESRLKRNNVKYCSRLCCDTHKKETYVGEKNPMYGKKISDDTKQKKSDIMKKIWENEEYKNKLKIWRDNYRENNETWLGCDEKSKLKRKETMIKKYGIEHNWCGKYGERDCDKTSLEKYGKLAVEFLQDYRFFYGKKTDIEQLFEDILCEMKIEFQPKHRIYNKNRDDFWYREYDFLIKNTNKLIEVDGDYWHGNQKLFPMLSESQIKTKELDIKKTIFAESNGFEVIRFWGDDIKNNRENIKIHILKLLNL